MESVFHLVDVTARVLKNVTSGDVKYGPETWEQEHQTKCSINDKIQLMFLLNGKSKEWQMKS